MSRLRGRPRGSANPSRGITHAAGTAATSLFHAGPGCSAPAIAALSDLPLCLAGRGRAALPGARLRRTQLATGESRVDGIRTGKRRRDGRRNVQLREWRGSGSGAPGGRGTGNSRGGLVCARHRRGNTGDSFRGSGKRGSGGTRGAGGSKKGQTR